MKIGKIYWFVAVILLVSNANAQEHKNWGYTGNSGPEYWQELDNDYHVCGNGKNQSPVNLTSFVKAELPELIIDYRSAIKDVVNNGHTVQVNVAPGSTITVNKHRYQLVQFHFHSPSENSIDGKSFPMEAHFVHTDEQGNLAVIAVMIAEGMENSDLQKIWRKMPKSQGLHAELSETLATVNLLPENKNYFRYSGSLTTPPCTEGVTWLVMKQSVAVSKAQIAQFTHVLHHPNNRPQQMLGARLVLE